MRYATATLLALVMPTPLAAEQPLASRVEAALANAGPGTRFGLVVSDSAGNEIVAINPDQRFIPASNTKIVTTAAAFATLPDLDLPDAAGGASVRLDRETGGHPDVILAGNGDARLSSAPDCRVDCLATLADAVAGRARVVRDIVGDDSLFPDQRWSPGMSWNNIPTRSGTGASALSLDDNELVLSVTPGKTGKPPILANPGYYAIDNRARTIATGASALGFDRAPNTRLLRVTGTIALGAAPQVLRVGIDDPAHYAAWMLHKMLRARGVRITGGVIARHRPLDASDDPAIRKAAPPARPPSATPLARLTPPPLAGDLVLINKVSQNLHAELLLRRVGLQAGTGSIADGIAVVRAMFARAGVLRTAYDFSDGSGMSTYNRITPRGMVTLLRWIAAQPWGTAWRETLPVGGVDGTLARRFGGTSLERKIFAKTGSLNATAALSGDLTARSGRTLFFSAYANDIPDGANATRAIDAALELIAAEN